MAELPTTRELPVLQPVPAAPATDAIRMEGVWASYDTAAYALRDVSLRVARGERRAIVGPSGSGKSTLLKVLKGLLPASQGETMTLDLPVHALKVKRELRARIGYIPQNLGLVSSATVMENALMGALHRVGEIRSWLGIFPKEEVDAAWEALEALGIDHLAQRRAYQISGGERRRLAVARALVQRPELLLADEFLSELDEDTAEQVLRGLEIARVKLGMTIVIVEHNLRVACSFCDRVTVLRDGKVVADEAGCDLDPQAVRCLYRQNLSH